MDHPQSRQIWKLNGELITVGTDFTHLGMDFNLHSYSATATMTMDTRLGLGRCTIYALMGAAMYGINGLNPKI